MCEGCIEVGDVFEGEDARELTIRIVVPPWALMLQIQHFVSLLNAYRLFPRPTGQLGYELGVLPYATHALGSRGPIVVSSDNFLTTVYNVRIT